MSTTVRRLGAWCLGALLTTLGAAATSHADAAGAPQVSYATTPDAVVVRYVEMVGELEEVDPGPALTIFGDGRAVVHYPAYMRRGGDHTIMLDRAEVDTLVGSLVSKGVATFDDAAVRQQLRAADAARAAALSTGGGDDAEFFAVTDPSTTVIELGVESYVGEDGSAVLAQTATRAVWRGLASDLARHPSVTALSDLAAARTELRALMDRVHATAAQ